MDPSVFTVLPLATKPRNAFLCHCLATEFLFNSFYIGLKQLLVVKRGLIVLLVDGESIEGLTIAW